MDYQSNNSVNQAFNSVGNNPPCYKYSGFKQKGITNFDLLYSERFGQAPILEECDDVGSNLVKASQSSNSNISSGYNISKLTSTSSNSSPSQVKI